MAEDINLWSAASDGPEGTKYLALKGEGDNAYLVRWLDGSVGRAYTNPAKGGIDALISDVLHPPKLPDPPPPEPDPRDVKIADLEAAVSALKKSGVLTDAALQDIRTSLPSPAIFHPASRDNS